MIRNHTSSLAHGLSTCSKWGRGLIPKTWQQEVLHALLKFWHQNVTFGVYLHILTLCLCDSLISFTSLKSEWARMPHRGNLGKVGSGHRDPLEIQLSIAQARQLGIQAKNPAGVRRDHPPPWSHTSGNDFVCGQLNKQRGELFLPPPRAKAHPQEASSSDTQRPFLIIKNLDVSPSL